MSHRILAERGRADCIPGQSGLARRTPPRPDDHHCQCCEAKDDDPDSHQDNRPREGGRRRRNLLRANLPTEDAVRCRSSLDERAA